MPKNAAPATPVAEPLTLPQTLLAPARVDVAYDGGLAPAEGGTAPYAYAITGGALPEGWTLGAADDATAVKGDGHAEGSFPFEVTVTDAAGAKAVREYTVRVDPDAAE
jgi:hypothetical protein